MPKRGQDYQDQRGGGDLAAGKRSWPDPSTTGSHDPNGEEGWSWRSLRSPPPPFDDYETITSYAVHSDGRTIFMTTSYSDRPGLNTKYCVWRWHAWVLPFDSDLDAWVGLDWDGYICSCEVPSDIGSENPIELGAMQLDCQVVEDKLFRKETDTESSSLTYMGGSKFCLVQSVRRNGAKDTHIVGDDDDGYVLHLTVFGLKYNS